MPEAETTQPLALVPLRAPRLHATRDCPDSAMYQRNTNLTDVLERVPALSTVMFSLLALEDRRACRGVCHCFRTAINGSVRKLFIMLSQPSCVEDELLRLARSSLRPTILTLHGTDGADSVELASELCAALLTPSPELAAVLRGIKNLSLVSLQVPLHLSARNGGSVLYAMLASVQVDEISLASCTQLMELCCINSFPGLSQLTQLRKLSIEISIDSLSVVAQLASLPHLVHLEMEKLDITLDQPSGNPHRFLFPSLTFLSVYLVHASLLASLDCPQLQLLVLSPHLRVDSAASLHACATGILQHCYHIGILTPGHGVTLAAMLAALAPWQPSAAALAAGNWQLRFKPGKEPVSASHLELLPAGLQSLFLRDCTLLPGALLPVARRLTRLKELFVTLRRCEVEDLELLASHAVQGSQLDIKVYSAGPLPWQFEETLRALQRRSSLAGQWGGRPGPRFCQG
ncbi:hypothetical protein QJQ45_022903 [Haematococcus lacustris]|nr:hypothetical protein QJQ45_022903 [Haematococcus lacustris]